MTAAIYCRISRDREGRELGVERQEAECRELADRLGLDVTAVFRENDISASTRSRKPRPEYEKLLRGAEEGRWKTILAWSSSRLTRRPLELERQIELAEHHDVRFHYVKSPSFDLNTAHGRMVARMLAAADAAEAEATSERLLAQKRQSAELGLYRGGRRPYGYEPDGATVRKSEADVIVWASRQILLGRSLGSVVRELNNLGERTSTGALWRNTELRRVLLRARTAGLSEHQGEIVGEAVWPAILPRVEWEALRRVLTDPSRRTSPGNEPRWLGSTLFRCGVCDDGTTVVARGAGRREWNQQKKYVCSGPVMHLGRLVAQVDRVVELTLFAYLSRPDVAAMLKTRRSVDTTELEDRARDLRLRLDEQAEAFGDGLLSRAQLARNTQRIRAELEKVEAELTRAVIEHPATELVTATDIESAWRRIDVSRRRAIVDALCTVTLLPARRGRPPGWRPGQPYFDPRTVRIDWKQP